MDATGKQACRLQLFDGAMTVELPPAFHDLSLLRPVPDHQEVYINGEAERSVIVEVVEYQQKVSNEEAGRFFFFDLMKENKASDAQLTSTRLVAADPQIPVSMQHVVVIASGTQRVPAEGNRESRVFLSIIRLPEHKAEVLLSSYSRPGTDNDAEDTVFAHALATFKIVRYSLFV